MAFISPVRIIFAATLAAAAFAQPARAAAPVSPSCGVTGSAIAATTVQYDPFAPTGLSQIDIPLTLTRATDAGGKKTQEVYFVLTQPAGGPNYSILASIGGSSYSNILYYDNAVPANLPVISTNTSGQAYYQFGGAAQPDTATIQLRVTVPAGVNLSAGDPIQFDIRYVCKGTGGMPDVLTPATLSKAISINVNVLSALQAGFVGSALDFGEIGTVSSALPAASFPKTPTSNYVRVQSSGPYEITLTSAGKYKMTPNGSPASSSLAEVKYRLKFLGKERSNSDFTPISMICPFAGVGTAEEDKLYLQAQLQEGGIGKSPSPNYLDTLTVTIAPKAAGTTTTSGGGCPGLSGTFP